MHLSLPNTANSNACPPAPHIPIPLNRPAAPGPAIVELDSGATSEWPELADGVAATWRAAPSAAMRRDSSKASSCWLARSCQGTATTQRLW